MLKNKETPQSFAPISDEHSRILILVTMPSVQSRKDGFYYAHPRNRFWQVISVCLGEPLPQSVEEKTQLLLTNKIALWDVLSYVNKKLNVVKYRINLNYPSYHDETLLYKIRQRLWQKPQIISEFIKKRSDYLSAEEIKLLQSWERFHVKGKFIIVKFLPKYAVLMHVEKSEAKLYAVKGMTTSISEAVHSQLPYAVETVLLPVGGKITYDSFMGSFGISFGDGFRDKLEEDYNEMESKYGIVESLE
jgi:hypothetical protein